MNINIVDTNKKNSRANDTAKEYDRIEHARVRFAPSPTGFMHLGNVRSALMNYIFACHFASQKSHEATFILRIEDTDVKRNLDELVDVIINDLNWLNLTYDEGPFYQSQHTVTHTEYLQKLIEEHQVYRCFCTPEELEKKRTQQLAQKLPPRYDRACLQLSAETAARYLAENKPYIWRFKLNYDTSVAFYDLAHKEMTFELKHFSDVPITRTDGSFTFLFANFVDDVTMRITHVLRGEDHLTNTAIQVALYHAFKAPIPVFWHLPILINQEGKKLSKRDFGFSLQELRNTGYLPEAICNYLGIIGGSFEQEILSLPELAATYNFDSIKPTGQIKYDTEKLRWVNQQWIQKISMEELMELTLPFLIKEFPQAQDMPREELISLFERIKNEMVTLRDVTKLLAFYFHDPVISQEQLDEHGCPAHQAFFADFIKQVSEDSEISGPQLLDKLKLYIKERAIKPRSIFMLTRLLLTGSTSGLRLDELFSILSPQVIQSRLSKYN